MSRKQAIAFANYITSSKRVLYKCSNFPYRYWFIICLQNSVKVLFRQIRPTCHNYKKIDY